jgi:hypothetical protein
MKKQEKVELGKFYRAIISEKGEVNIFSPTTRLIISPFDPKAKNTEPYYDLIEVMALSSRSSITSIQQASRMGETEPDGSYLMCKVGGDTPDKTGMCDFCAKRVDEPTRRGTITWYREDCPYQGSLSGEGGKCGKWVRRK